MNAIILCGGLSTRLGEITKETPKIMLPVGGKPILDWQLEKLKSVNVQEVVLAAGHLAHVLYHQADTKRLGMELTYAIEDKKLGTGGAIKHAMSYLKESNEPFFVLNGDILYTIDFADMRTRLKPESEGIILAQQVRDASLYGTLEFDEKDMHLKSFKEKEGIAKPAFINGGLYLFTAKVKEHFPSQDAFSIEYDVFPNMKDLYVYPSESPWVDVGVPERLEWAREHWADFA